MDVQAILKKIDGMTSYIEKLEYLTDLYLNCSDISDEKMILELISQLKQWGK